MFNLSTILFALWCIDSVSKSFIMDRKLKKLITAHQKYEGVISQVQEEIKNKIEFDDFFIQYQPSDGFVLVYGGWENRSLATCLSIIKDEGRLTLDEYLSIN